MRPQFVDRTSFIVAFATFFVGLALFFSETNDFWGSFEAAILAAALMWVAYVLTRWVYLALK
jgi:divalent metal cation (Fe/Co/Zn/Cd) transporter